MLSSVLSVAVSSAAVLSTVSTAVLSAAVSVVSAACPQPTIAAVMETVRTIASNFFIFLLLYTSTTSDAVSL